MKRHHDESLGGCSEGGFSAHDQHHDESLGGCSEGGFSAHDQHHDDVGIDLMGR